MAMDGAFRINTNKEYTFRFLVRKDEEIPVVVKKLKDAGFDKIRVVNNKSEGISNKRSIYNIEIDAKLESSKAALLVLRRIRTISEGRVGTGDILVRE